MLLRGMLNWSQQTAEGTCPSASLSKGANVNYQPMAVQGRETEVKFLSQIPSAATPRAVATFSGRPTYGSFLGHDLYPMVQVHCRALPPR